MYQVTKTYGHERGISCAFRQHLSESHCNQIHGYALSFSFVFESETLNGNKWVIDFGDLRELEKQIRDRFDHKYILAKDDPAFNQICELRNLACGGILDLTILPSVGCESFAYYAYLLASPVVKLASTPSHQIKIKSVTVAEHGSNSATYKPN